MEDRLIGRCNFTLACETMNLKKIESKLSEIKMAINFNHDNELAHMREDDLWYNILKAISEGASNPKELAAKCLESKDIEYVRWYA